MEEGSSRATGRSSRRARILAGVVLAVVVVAVFAGAMLRGHHGASDPWVAGYESADAGALAQDAAQIRTDLALSPSSAVAALRYDCEIGRRDAARLLSHLSPANPTLRRAYEAVLHQNWRLYALCAGALAAHADVSTVSVQLDRQLAVLGRDESRVNDVARAVGFAPVFAGVR